MGVSIPRGPIPARAGEPASSTTPGGAGGAYPRACGGTVNIKKHANMEKGLSPRVRGNPNSLFMLRAYFGPIPARAGEPQAIRSGVSLDGAYPRACGGTESRLSSRSTHSGLSPRVRGNRASNMRPPSKSGPIPARAGEPRAGSALAPRSRAYPRACGGTGSHIRSRCRYPGLSPRVRGNLPGPHGPWVRNGPIPARAGEPSCSPW